MSRNNYSLLSAAILTAGLAAASAASAQDMYISGSLGIADQQSSNNNGRFIGVDANGSPAPFVTGTVTGVNPPLSIPAGESVGWKTSYDNGDYYNLTLGWDIDIVRMELEYTRSAADVDTHRGVSAAGIDLSDIDAGVLITGNEGDLGVSVAGLVANGQGEIDTKSVMLNMLYDFDLDLPITPYAGIGLGMRDTTVTFRPSDVDVMSDNDVGFSYQLILGATYNINDRFDVFANYRYRDGREISVDANLFPARFKLDNQAHVFDLGLRVKF